MDDKVKEPASVTGAVESELGTQNPTAQLVQTVQQDLDNEINIRRKARNQRKALSAQSNPKKAAELKKKIQLRRQKRKTIRALKNKS